MGKIKLTDVKPGMKVSLKSPFERKPDVMWVEGVDVSDPSPHFATILRDSDHPVEKKVTLFLNNKKGASTFASTPSQFESSGHKLFELASD